MTHTIDDTIVYVLLLTRHIRMGDISAAILALLVELGFSASHDGFVHLRKAILLRYKNPNYRFNELYREIGLSCEPVLSTSQIDQSIRGAIETAWKHRNEKEWSYFFRDRRTGNARKPSNGDFIATMACVMELWSSCFREGCYESK